jgi:hypothetical protein
MTGIQALRTVFIGLAIMLASLTGAGAWGISRKVITTLPADSAMGFLIVAIVAVLSIPVACYFIREPKEVK